mmetsp:Transcript_22261/g.69094  ORF Transcript_22261/g.69094 Transcript_22261/m.69094 type:complete len:333 (+) Transcript_22261:2689-3687(+)
MLLLADHGRRGLRERAAVARAEAVRSVRVVGRWAVLTRIALAALRAGTSTGWFENDLERDRVDARDDVRVDRRAGRPAPQRNEDRGVRGRGCARGVGCERRAVVEGLGVRGALHVRHRRRPVVAATSDRHKVRAISRESERAAERGSVGGIEPGGAHGPPCCVQAHRAHLHDAFGDTAAVAAARDGGEAGCPAAVGGRGCRRGRRRSVRRGAGRRRRRRRRWRRRDRTEATDEGKVACVAVGSARGVGLRETAGRECRGGRRADGACHVDRNAAVWRRDERGRGIRERCREHLSAAGNHGARHGGEGRVGQICGDVGVANSPPRRRRVRADE